MSLSVKEVADYAGISTSSVRVWGKKLTAVLSDGATPKRGVQRRFTNEDAIIFHTAKILKSEGEEWARIVESIQKGERVIASEQNTLPLEESGQGTALPLVPLSVFDKVVETVSTERDNLRADLENERLAHEKTRRELIEAINRASSAEARAGLYEQLQALKEEKPTSRKWWQFWKN